MTVAFLLLGVRDLKSVTTNRTELCGATNIIQQHFCRVLCHLCRYCLLEDNFSNSDQLLKMSQIESMTNEWLYMNKLHKSIALTIIEQVEHVKM